MTPLYLLFQNNIILSVQFKPTIRNIYAHKNLQLFSENYLQFFSKSPQNFEILTKTKHQNFQNAKP